MALEMRVYAEITQMEPKPLLNMTWRQLFLCAVATPLIAGISVGLYFAGQMDATSYVVILVAIPLALLGWIKPMGVPFETFAARVWKSRRTGLLIYSNTPQWSSHFTPSYEGKRNVAPGNHPRRRVFISEAGN